MKLGMLRVLVFYVCDILYVCVISALSVMCFHLIVINCLSFQKVGFMMQSACPPQQADDLTCDMS